MNNSTRVFLVLLRFAIGWHLLFAGVVKFHEDYRGSEGYLREASGPLAPFFHGLAGDRLVDRCTVQPLGPDQDPAKVSYKDRFPKLLGAEWDAYFDRFVRYYELDEGQQGEARKNLDQQKEATVAWLLNGTKEMKKTSPWGPSVSVERTTEGRVEDYVARRDDFRRNQEAGAYTRDLGLGFGTAGAREFLAEKAEVARLRGDLSKDLEERTAAMKESLRDVLKPEQAKKGALPGPARPGWLEMGRLDWVDFQVRWGLVLVGACLVLGLFTRTACVAGALLLLSFYLAVPPLPGVPEALRVEGYPFVNKNLVELLALLTLATTLTGRWVGLDGLIQFFRAGRKAARPAAPTPAPNSPVPEPVVIAAAGRRAP